LGFTLALDAPDGCGDALQLAVSNALAIRTEPADTRIGEIGIVQY
jgi:hypothetical protein